MRRIKRTKITVIRTETVFLKMQDGVNNAEFVREYFEVEPAALEPGETERVLEIEAIKQETDSQGEVK